MAAIAVALLVAACTGSDATSSARPSDTGATTTTTAPADPYRLETTSGPVRGGPSAVDGVRHFLAVPYAEAPVGELAWRPPRPRRPWTETRRATDPGVACPQRSAGSTGGLVVMPEQDPDCLQLNVWAPDDAAGLPVMVWIHGGGFSSGSASQPLYQGDWLAKGGAVVVGVNYRLGPQGFLVTEELRRESERGAVGNYGLLDQQLALRWVQDNIERFGGDPANVTIFGESAGGFSVCGHLAASRGLFHKAIIQSGGGCLDLTPLDQALEDGRRLLEAISCTDTACLRAARPEDLVGVDGFTPSLVADGVVLSSPAYRQAEHGALDAIPVLVGGNADEATLFTYSLAEPTDDALLGFAAPYTDDPGALVARYPREAFASNKARFQAMFTDAVFVCPALALAEIVPHGFAYHYTFVADGDPFGVGATHGAELPVLFGHPEGLTLDIEVTDRTRSMSATMQRAWLRFAATGDPGEAFEPHRSSGLVTLLDVPVQQVAQIRDGRCDDVNALIGR